MSERRRFINRESVTYSCLGIALLGGVVGSAMRDSSTPVSSSGARHESFFMPPKPHVLGTPASSIPKSTNPLLQIVASSLPNQNLAVLPLPADQAKAIEAQYVPTELPVQVVGTNCAGTAVMEPASNHTVRLSFDVFTDSRILQDKDRFFKHAYNGLEGHGQNDVMPNHTVAPAGDMNAIVQGFRDLLTNECRALLAVDPSIFSSDHSMTSANF